MTGGEFIALLCGVLVPMLGGFGWLGYQFGVVKTNIKNLPTKEDLRREIRNHSDRCPGSKGEVSGVFAAIPERPRP